MWADIYRIGFADGAEESGILCIGSRSACDAALGDPRVTPRHAGSRVTSIEFHVVPLPMWVQVNLQDRLSMRRRMTPFLKVQGLQ